MSSIGTTIMETQLLEKSLDEVCDYIRYIKHNTEKIDKSKIGIICQKTIMRSFDTNIFQIIRRWKTYVKNFLDEISQIINLINILNNEIPEFIDIKSIIIKISEKIRTIELQRKKINNQLFEYIIEKYKTKVYPVITNEGKLDLISN